MMADNVYHLWKQQLRVGENGPKKCLTNLMLFLRNMPQLGPNLRWNELSQEAEWHGRPLSEEDVVDIRMLIENEKYQPEKGDMDVAIRRTAQDNRYHPIRDYLDGLKWDGKPRLDIWLSRIFGAPDTEYERLIGPKWLIGAVARAYQPGCKMDNMLVLEGPQEIGKSSALRNLFGPDYFTEMSAELRDNKRFVEQILGKWVIEFAELATLRGANLEHAKAIITTQTDRVMRNYAKRATDHPRQCVLAATVNPQEDAGYLRDATGNRRFWPVACTKVEMEALIRHRDQFWAEAVHRYRAGERWWLEGAERALASGEQEQRVAVDPWEDILTTSGKLFDHCAYTATQVLQEIIGMPKDRITKTDKARMGATLKRLGWKQFDAKDADRRTYQEWRKRHV
jgi:predicted P-loop ATPase